MLNALLSQESEERAKVARAWTAPFAEWSQAFEMAKSRILTTNKKVATKVAQQSPASCDVDARREISRISSLPSDCSPFEVFSLRPQASEAEILKEYKRLWLLTHPDKHPEDGHRAKDCFQRVRNAKDDLMDPVKRHRWVQQPGASREDGLRDTHGNWPVRSMDVRFGADAVDMMTEEQEISTVRDWWNLWMALADGQRVAFLAPGLRVCEGVLKLAGIETGTRYNGYVWLVHLDGDSVLIRLTNSRRLFALRTSCERVKNEVLAERAMAQARSRSYFFGFSTAARTAPREQ